MAIWQYEISILSASDIEGDEIHDNTYDNLKGWKRDSVHKKISNLLTPNMIKSESWSENIEIWGEVDKTCFKIFFESDRIIEINVRIDLRYAQDKIVLSNILELCTMLNARIVNSELKLIPPNQIDIVKDINQSSAFKFVSDPKIFIESL